MADLSGDQVTKKLEAQCLIRLVTRRYCPLFFRVVLVTKCITVDNDFWNLAILIPILIEATS